MTKPIMEPLHECEISGCGFVGTAGEASEHVERNDGHTTMPMPEEPNPDGRKPQLYECLHEGDGSVSSSDCAFEGTFEEWQEHQAGTGHHKYDIHEGDEPAEQGALFDSPGILKRTIEKPVTEGFLAETKTRVAELLRQKFDIEADKSKVNKELGDQIKAIDTELHTLVKVLKNPATTETVECEWRPCDDKPEKVLVRIDTQEVLETAALSAEERAEWEKRS